MSRATIYQDDHLMTAQLAEESERLGGGSALHSVQTDLWGNLEVGSDGIRGIARVEICRRLEVIVRNEEVETRSAAVAVGPLLLTVVAKPLFAADREFLRGKTLDWYSGGI